MTGIVTAVIGTAAWAAGQNGVGGFGWDTATPQDLVSDTVVLAATVAGDDGFGWDISGPDGLARTP